MTRPLDVIKAKARLFCGHRFDASCARPLCVGEGWPATVPPACHRGISHRIFFHLSHSVSNRVKGLFNTACASYSARPSEGPV